MIVLCWGLLTACVVLVIRDCTDEDEFVLITDDIYCADEVIVVPGRTPVTGRFQCTVDAESVVPVMPCDRYEEVEDEQTASEETDVCDESIIPGSIADMEGPQTTCPETVENPCELAVEESVLVLSETTPEPIPEVTTVPADITEGDAEVYADDLTAGDMDDDCPEGDAMALGDLEDYLRGQLAVNGAEWFYPYAWCQVMQESNWNPWAENANGQDKGLLQFRAQFWREPESIFDPYAQIRRYVREVTARINAGLSVEEVISRHYTSDYVTEVNWEYVNHVLSWMR